MSTFTHKKLLFSQVKSKVKATLEQVITILRPKFFLLKTEGIICFDEKRQLFLNIITQYVGIIYMQKPHLIDQKYHRGINSQIINFFEFSKLFNIQCELHKKYTYYISTALISLILRSIHSVSFRTLHQML